MIHFIICEDEIVFVKKYKEEIDKIMMNYDIEYKYHIYKGYTEKFKEIAQEDLGFKIYILDLRTSSGSGLDAARLIREEYDDWNSMIIIITAYPEHKYEIIGKRLLLLDFINKLDNCDKRLQEAIKISLKNFDRRPKTLKYVYKKVIYNIEFRRIIYIEKEQDNKRCIIKTNNGEYLIQGNLNTVLKLLDKRFKKCCRSIIINLEQVESYNPKNNTLTFKNKEELIAVSRDKKKEIMNYVRGIN